MSIGGSIYTPSLLYVVEVISLETNPVDIGGTSNPEPTVYSVNHS